MVVRDSTTGKQIGFYNDKAKFHVHNPVHPRYEFLMEARESGVSQEFTSRVFNGVGPQPDGTIMITPLPFPSTAVTPVTSAFQPPVSVPFSQTVQALTAGSGVLSTQQNAIVSLQTSSSASPVLSVQQTLSGQPIGSSFIVPASTNTTFTLSAPRALFRINFSWPTTS